MADKEIRRIIWNTVKKIMFIIYDEGMQKRTKLAMMSNMAYDNFGLYLKWMIFMNLLTMTDNDLVALTDFGILKTLELRK